MATWEAQVKAALAELLSTHKKVYIVAHSLGTLLALEQAVHTEGIGGMFLLAVPLRLFLRPVLVKTSMKVWLNRIRPEDAWDLAARDCCSITQERNPLLYLGWIPRFYELLVEAHRAKSKLARISVPCQAFQSRRDELVSRRAYRILQKQPHIQTTELQNSGHFAYKGADLDLLKTSLSRFLQELSQ